MSEEDSRRRWRWKTRLIGGSLGGVLLGVGLVHAELVASLNNVTVRLLGASPGNALRVLQSVGILLPLFTGLLRFTARDSSGVDERVTDYLLLGIVALVLAGVFATVAGTLTKTTIVLKLSLLFVLFAFTIIGLAAVVVFKGLDDATGTGPPDASEREKDDEEVHAEAKTSPSGPENAGNDEGIESGDESPSDSKGEHDNPSNESAKTRSVATEEDGEGQEL